MSLAIALREEAVAEFLNSVPILTLPSKTVHSSIWVTTAPFINLIDLSVGLRNRTGMEEVDRCTTPEATATPYFSEKELVSTQESEPEK